MSKKKTIQKPKRKPRVRDIKVLSTGRPKVSTKTRLEMLEQGKKELEIIGTYPVDHGGKCVCAPLVKSDILEAKEQGRRKKHIVCPRAKKEGMKRYNVYCKACNDLLGYFFNTKAKLDSNYCNLHYVNNVKSRTEVTEITEETEDEKGNIKEVTRQETREVKEWHGALGVNYNSETGEVNFECACGNKKILERRPSVGDIPKNYRKKENAVINEKTGRMVGFKVGKGYARYTEYIIKAV